MAKEPGDVGLEERGLGGGCTIESLEVQGLLCERESRFDPGGLTGQLAQWVDVACR